MPRGSGRRPKPTALKKLHGNPGKRALNEHEPAVTPGAPEMPAGLSDAAQQEWRAIVPELLALGVLTKIDGKALAAYCISWARWMQAEAEIDAKGILIVEPVMNLELIQVGEKIKTNPAVAVADRERKAMKSFLVEFGLTPASRSRLSVKDAGEKTKDPADRYFSGTTSAHSSSRPN